MKLSDIEDAGQLVTKEDLAGFELRMERRLHEMEMRLQEFQTAIRQQLHTELLTMSKWMGSIFVAMALSLVAINLGALYFLTAHFKS